MEQFSPAEIATYTLEAIVLGAVVMRGYFVKRRQRRIATPPTEFDFQNAAPFELSYAVGAEITAGPNTEITPGLFLYFNISDEPRISYQQVENTKSLGGNYYRYFLRVAQNDVNGLEWLAVERRTEIPIQSGGSRMECKVSASASQSTKVKLLLIYQAENGEEKRVELGIREVSEEFSEFQMDIDLSDHRFEVKEGLALLRYVVLPEIKAGLSFNIRSWDFNLVKPA